MDGKVRKGVEEGGEGVEEGGLEGSEGWGLCVGLGEGGGDGVEGDAYCDVGPADHAVVVCAFEDGVPVVG